MGVMLASRNLAQVSINLTDFEQTPMHLVFETVRREAERYGVSVVGSEIVGLIPQEGHRALRRILPALREFPTRARARKPHRRSPRHALRPARISRRAGLSHRHSRRRQRRGRGRRHGRRARLHGDPPGQARFQRCLRRRPPLFHRGRGSRRRSLQPRDGSPTSAPRPSAPRSSKRRSTAPPKFRSR